MQTMKKIHAELQPSQKPQKPEARSQKPKARRSQKPEAKSQKPNAEARSQSQPNKKQHAKKIALQTKIWAGEAWLKTAD